MLFELLKVRVTVCCVKNWSEMLYLYLPIQVKQ